MKSTEVHHSLPNLKEQTLLVPRIASPREYEAALARLQHLQGEETGLLADAYRERILEWEDHDYLFED